MPGLSDIDNDLGLVADGDPLVQKLVRLRGNVLAHTNAANVADELQLDVQFGLSMAEMQALVDRAMDIVNRNGNAIIGNTWSPRIVGHDDYLAVLKAIRFHGQETEARLDAEIRSYTTPCCPFAQRPLNARPATS
jgi:hypothetical protein